MKLNNSVKNSRRCFVLSVDDTNRVTAFVNVLIQVNKRVHLCKKERNVRKRSTKKTKITSIKNGPLYRGPFCLTLLQIIASLLIYILTIKALQDDRYKCQ